jgi:hypothetical protein
MRRSKFTNTRLVTIPREVDASVGVADLLCEHRISRSTLFMWRRERVAGLQHMWASEREGARLRPIYVAKALEFTETQGCADRKTVTRSARRAVVTILTQDHGPTVQRACRMTHLVWPCFTCESAQAAANAPVIAALEEGTEHDRWGLWTCFATERKWNHIRVYRVLCAPDLNPVSRTQKRLPRRDMARIQATVRLDDRWTKDFMSNPCNPLPVEPRRQRQSERARNGGRFPSAE